MNFMMLSLLASAATVEQIEEMSADDALSAYGQEYVIFVAVGNWKVRTALPELYLADKICGKPANMSARVNHSQKSITLRDQSHGQR